MICPKCKSQLEQKENGIFVCPNCKARFKLSANSGANASNNNVKQNSTAAGPKKVDPTYNNAALNNSYAPNYSGNTTNGTVSAPLQPDSQEVEGLKQRIATLETQTLQGMANKAKAYVKSNFKWLFPTVLALLLFIILMISFYGLRGIYVNVDDPNDFMDFGVSKYTSYSVDETGASYMESGKYKLKRSTLTLKSDFGDFGELEANFRIYNNAFYTGFTIIDNSLSNESTEYKRVSIIGYNTTVKKVTVTFDPCNGQQPKQFKIKLGSTLYNKIDEPTNGVQKFFGWYNERNGIFSESAKMFNPKERIWSDVTYYACWAYGIDEDGTLSQVDKNSVGESVVIPNYVKSIGENVFEGCEQIRSLYIPTSVTDIDYSAFSGCENIVSLSAPGELVGHIPTSSLETLYVLNGEFVGSRLEKLKELRFSSSVTKIDLSNSMYDLQRITVDYGNANYFSYDGSLYKQEYKSLIYVPMRAESVDIYDGCIVINKEAFRNHTSLNTITIPNSVTYIDLETFYNCTGLQTVTIPDSVTSIGRDAFYSCTGLQTVTIGEGVISIGDYAFGGCTRLESISISEGNKTYQSKDGIVYKKSNKTIYIVPKNLQSEVSILEGCTSIDNYAFSNCVSLTSVVIPNSVTSIGENAFGSCTGLQTVTIGKNVNSIGESAFGGCTRLESISISEGNKTYQSKDGIVYKKSNKTIYIVPKNLQGEVSILEGCTSIDHSAFSNCVSLTSVAIPDSVTSIGDYAFYDCTGLHTMTISEGVESIGNKAFGGCTKITTVTMPGLAISYIPKDKLTVVTITSGKIESTAFKGCTGLSSVTIGEGVQSIGWDAFYGCTGLREVTIGEGVQSIGNNAFGGCTKITTVTMPGLAISDIPKDNITVVTITSGKIENSAFRGCTGLQTVTIGEGVQSIGAYAFYNCTGLSEITIPNSVTSIGDSAFYGCTGLQTAIIKTQSVGNGAFYNCRGLQTVTIGEGVQSIGKNAFVDCIGIINVNYLGTLKGWCEIEFGDNANPLYDATYNRADTAKLYMNDEEVTGDVNIPYGTSKIGNGAFYDLVGITSVTIPESVTSIGSSAFEGCKGLANIIIPVNVQSIGYYAFQNCKGLKEIIIHDSVTSIGYWAFYGCTGLRTVTIGKKVQDIGKGAFASCRDLQNVTIPDSVQTIGDRAFEGCSLLQKVSIGKGVRSIGEKAFYDCRNLRYIYYSGDKAQWENISKGSSWNEYYSSGTYYTINYHMFYNSTGLALASAASNISALPSEQPVLIACDRFDLWVKMTKA